MTPQAPQSQSLAEYILDFSSETEYQKQYAITHLGRLVRTLELTPPGTAQDSILEMGAYMQITPALKHRLGYGDVRGSYLGPAGRREIKSVTSQRGEIFACPFDLYNAEKDWFPYQDGQFATVICCELFEHLSEDPMFLLEQVNRILRPGGVLVMSTPNITSLRSVRAILTGYHPALYQNFIQSHGGAPPDPRHAREYTPQEMRWAVEAAGFEATHLETGAQGAQEESGLDWVANLLAEKDLPADLRGQTIHIVATKIGGVRDRFPSWLYD